MSKKDYNFTDCKPIGTLATKDLINLEHKYRLLLKKSGFSDIEMWDNKPKQKIKKLKFIKGHLRKPSSSPLKNAYHEIQLKWNSNFNYYQLIGLYAYHCKDVPSKYANILQDLSLTGNLALSIRNTKSNQSHEALRAFIKKNLPKMIEFVNKEFGYE